MGGLFDQRERVRVPLGVTVGVLLRCGSRGEKGNPWVEKFLKGQNHRPGKWGGEKKKRRGSNASEERESPGTASGQRKGVKKLGRLP